MSDEENDPRPYDPEELDDDVNSVTEDGTGGEGGPASAGGSAGGGGGGRAGARGGSVGGADHLPDDLKQQEKRLDELKSQIDMDDPTGTDELLRGMPRGVGSDNPQDIDDEPAPTHPADPAP
jgi:hypothetical protein